MPEEFDLNRRAEQDRRAGTEDAACPVLSEFREVRAALDADSLTVEYPFRASRLTLGPTILDTDGPRHQQGKKILSRLVSGASLEHHRVQTIRPVVRSCWDALAGQPDVDILRDFARVVPPRIIFAMLDLPDEAAVSVYERDIKPIAMFIADNRTGYAAASDAHDRVKQFIDQAECDSHPAATVREIVRAYQAVGMSRGEGLSAVALLLAAGTETTIGAIGNLFWFVYAFPDSWGDVVAGRLAERTFIDETLRLGAPLNRTVRFVRKSAGTSSEPSAAGVVELQLGLANLTQPAIDEPAAWCPHQGRGLGATFGFGRHACIGKALALTELTEIVTLLRDGHFTADRIVSTGAISGSTFRRPVDVRVRF